MLSALASVLLLGIVPPEAPVTVAQALPGIETVSVAAPSEIIDRFQAPVLSASGVLLIDAQSGEEIYGLDADARRPMASLTKIMTALLVLENHGMREIVTVPPIADQVKGSTIGVQTGERLTVESMLKALLLPSANDAAYALAVFHGRSVGAFVQMMNQRGEALGLKNTHFANPAGLDNEGQYSTPRDLSWLSLAALKDASFSAMVGTRRARIVSLEGNEYDLRNTNEMLHFNEDVLGVKTGTTDSAGECLIVLFTEGNTSYLLVLLGSGDRYADTVKVMQAVADATP